MRDIDIRNKCHVNTNREADTFVGLKCVDGDISIHFPLGFHISEDDKELRKDIRLLFSVLSSNTEHKDSEMPDKIKEYMDVEFPLQAYLYIIEDYFARGYYKERENVYISSRNGKINWNRTIKKQKPYVQGTDVFYLDYIVKRNTIKENELITLIHKYCVYESFEKIGWLFSRSLPEPPEINKNNRLFKAIVSDKLKSTFNDKNRLLFRNMVAILDYQGDKNVSQNYRYGTYRFEYIWEKMIDRVFGIDNKADYFPKTRWIIDNKMHDNASLEPDTIMVWENEVFVIDAKYYKYGVTGRVSDLPESTSINKQITYGEYVKYERKFRQWHGEDLEVYNAFLMPFDALGRTGSDFIKMVRVGEAVSTWKDDCEKYQKIQGVLVDVKTLMQISVRREESMMQQLAKLIKANA